MKISKYKNYGIGKQLSKNEIGQLLYAIEAYDNLKANPKSRQIPNISVSRIKIACIEFISQTSNINYTVKCNGQEVSFPIFLGNLTSYARGEVTKAKNIDEQIISIKKDLIFQAHAAGYDLLA